MAWYGRAGSGAEFRVNFVSGRVGLLHLWVWLGWVKKIGPMPNSAVTIVRMTEQTCEKNDKQCE